MANNTGHFDSGPHMQQTKREDQGFEGQIWKRDIGNAREDSYRDCSNGQRSQPSIFHYKKVNQVVEGYGFYRI